MKRLLIFFLLITAVGVAPYAYKELKGFILTSEYFDVKNIEITGIINGNADKLKRLCRQQMGVNLFSFRLNTKEISSDKWIERVEIKRLWPSRVKVIVYENKELFGYKSGGACYVYTYKDTSVPVSCSKKKPYIYISEEAFRGKLEKFAEIYKNAAFESVDKVVLNQSHFTVYRGDYYIKGSYKPSEFVSLYKSSDFIAGRYSDLEYLDLRVPGRIYAKGVLNEAG